MTLSPGNARITLGAIRLLNGTVALFAPEFMLRRLGADPAANGVAIHPLRMFGVRTVILALDLLLPERLSGKARRRALCAGIAIHATDALSAASAGLQHRLPARVAAVATAVSVTNTALAITMAGADRQACRTRRKWRLRR